jgi:hypothetical protein
MNTKRKMKKKMRWWDLLGMGHHKGCGPGSLTEGRLGSHLEFRAVREALGV